MSSPRAGRAKVKFTTVRGGGRDYVTAVLTRGTKILGDEWLEPLILSETCVVKIPRRFCLRLPIRHLDFGNVTEWEDDGDDGGGDDDGEPMPVAVTRGKR